MRQERWRRVAIIGLGLIGSSLARLLRTQDLADEIVASGSRPATLQRGLDLGIIDHAYADLATAVAECDLVVLAMPVAAIASTLAAIAPHLAEDSVVTDVGSVKGAVVDEVQRLLGRVPPCFVPGHPIAGAETSGVDAGDADLFRRHKVILTPLPDTQASAVAAVERLWRSAGAELICMSVAAHDSVLAKTSHLPHLLAFSLVDTLARESENLEIFRYAAGGFRDFTRIAASDPRMWHDIALSNRPALHAALDLFQTGLDQLRQAIDAGDGEVLLRIFSRAKRAREHFSHMLAGTAYAKTKSAMNIEFQVQPGGRVQGRARVPGDKSISHRSIMLGAIAEGITDVHGFLEGEDALSTLQAFRDMGVQIEGPEHGHVRVHGVGLHGLKPSASPLYLGNSGTSMRLLCGMLCGQTFDSVLTGDASLSRRPMQRIAQPLTLMGAHIDTTGDRGTPPLRIQGGQSLQGRHYDMPVASAQVKSGILLAGLWAQGETSVREPAPTRDHTERMLRGFGYAVERQGDCIRLRGGGHLQATQIDVPADISSAAFFMVAASIAPGSELLLEHVGINPTRTGIIDILRLMGGDIEMLEQREIAGEPVANLRIRHAPLHGIDIPLELVPLAIDEFPVIFVAAACAKGRTILRGAEELRVKESDRIQVMAEGLQALGVAAQATADGMIIDGGRIAGGRIDSHGDHRIAMAFAVAALRAEAGILIADCANVATSFPGFADMARELGLGLQVLSAES